jgi:hypothetical protein
VDSHRGGFVRVASVGDPSSARLCAALLDSAGIPVRLHGESLGPYVMRVGEMAVTEIWVLPEDVGDAIEVLTAAEIDDTLVLADGSPGDADSAALPMRAIALAVALILGLAVVVALMRVF